ncbi:MAG: hypothetical protein AAF244_01945 [Pseudomonadota bacterium]
MPQNKNISSQSGNIFMIILIGVLLFAALLYTFSRSLQTGTSNISAQQAEIAAQEMLNYARMLDNAVSRVRQYGCSENEISFENDEQPSRYNNLNAPSDNSCHIFDQNGGGVEWQDLQYGEIFIDDGNCITDVGRGTSCTSADAELLLYVIDIDAPICLEINNRVNNIDKNIIPSSVDFDITLIDDGFEGAFNSGTPTSITGETIDTFATGCGQDSSGTTSGQYVFYHTLIAR